MTPSCGLLVVLALTFPAQPSSPAADPADMGRLTLPTDAKARRMFQVAEDYVHSEDWQASARAFRELLELPQDVFVQKSVKGPDGKAVETFVGARTSAARLLAGLPELDKLEPRTLYEVARTLHSAGTKEDRASEEKVRKQLRAKAPQGLRIDGRDRGLKELEEALEAPGKTAPSKSADWPMFGGTPSRDGQGSGDTPFMQPLWKFSLLGPEAGQVKDWIYAGPNSAVKRLEARGEPIIPASAPVTATLADPKTGQPRAALVYRAYDGVHARDLKSGKLLWFSASPWSLEKMLLDPQKQQSITQWVAWYKDQLNKPGVLLENSTVGTPCIDGGHVYYIDDLAIPPPVSVADPRFGGFPRPGEKGEFSPGVKAGVQGNRLMCVLASGKLAWSLPEIWTDEGARPKLKYDFHESYFLGPPLALGGKLYFLNEKDQEIRLVCFDPGKLPEHPTEKDKDDAVGWVQPLGTAKEKMLADYGRRINAAHVAYGEGILVCPTNAGVLLGVDLLTHSLVWAHAYAQPEATGNPVPPGVRARVFPVLPTALDGWKASAPVVTGGKVIFASPDGPDLMCLSLRDGAEIWKAKRGRDDVYLAGVFAGRVVVVSRTDVRGLALADGKELWRVPTGMPSGRGAASDNVYYLPLKEAVFSDKEKGPGVVAIDVKNGRVITRTRSRKERDGTSEVPGNLVFFDGQVVSQSATEVVAYPQLKAQLEQTNRLLEKNANDPVGLLERGELRLDRGDLAGAVEDLRAVLKNGPPAEVKGKAEAKLFDALTELLWRDFGNGEKYLDEYRRLCTVTPTKPEEAEAAKKETRRRAAGLLCLLARGRESQGKPGEALDKYLEFAALPAAAQDGLLSVIDEPSVRARPDVWARGRIKALMERATPEQRKALEKVIADRWAEVKKGGDIAKLRAFVNLFGSTSAGKEGRLLLAQRLTEGERKADMIEAELQLQQLARDDAPAVAARAHDELARLYARKGLLKDAYKYYRLLKVRFPDTPVRDGKTGAQLYEDIATDKRFLPHIDEPPPVAAKVKFKVTEELGKNFPQPPPNMLYTYEPVSEPLPSLRDLRVAVNYQTNHLKLTDRRTGKEELSEPLKGNFQLFMNSLANYDNLGQPQAPPLGYQSSGHLVIVNLGQYVAALDAVNYKVLWERDLLGGQGAGGGQPYLNPDGWRLELLFPPNNREPIAQVGPARDGYVCLQTRDGLTALDPLTGKVLWARGDVPPLCRLLGDDNTIYVVELGNNGLPSRARAFRAEDGSSVPVPDFAAVYTKRQAVLGRELLLADTRPAGVTLRLYDIPTGKDLWAQEFAPGSVVLRSEEPDLAGAVEPSGQVAIVDLRQRKVVLEPKVARADLKNVQQAHLLSDDRSVYIAFHVNNPKDQGAIYPNLQGNTGLRAITVNGEVYAFDCKSGKLRWHNLVEHQQLVLEQWKEMPLLLFTSRHQPMLNAPDGGRFMANFQQVRIEAYAKLTGRCEYRQPSEGHPAMTNQNYQQIYAVSHDVRGGKIELIAPNYKITLTPDDGKKP